MKYYWLLFIAFLTLPAFGQQEGQFTQFMFNKQVYNPAYSGSRGVPTLSGIYRQQWISFNGAPENQQLGFNMPILNDRVGVGLLLSRQSVGITQNIGGALSYSYSLVKTEKLSLKLGLQGSFEQFSINFLDKDLVIREPGDPSTNSQSTSSMSGNVGAGLYLTHTNAYFGISIPRMLESKLGINQVGTETATRTQHYYAMAGVAIPLSKKIRLLPATLVKYTANSPLSIDGNLGVEFMKTLTVGASYRLDSNMHGDSVDLLLHYLIKKRLGVGVAYDYSLSSIKDFTKGSAELLLQYNFKSPNKKNRGLDADMSNPRFFF